MRIKICFTKNTEAVPNNQSVVNSYMHTKCLGNNNEYHDKPSDYCISRLLGGEIVDGGKQMNFPNGGYILVTSMNFGFIDKVINGVINNPTLGYGMEFICVDHITELFYSGWNYFKTTTMGFIIRRKEPVGNQHYYTINDADINEVIKNHIVNKFSKINPELDFSNLVVAVTDHPSNRVKSVYSKNVKNMTNICQVNINTNKLLAEYIYNYGIGQSCGSGFGTVYTTQYKDFYK